MQGWIWVSNDAGLALHREQIVQHGGGEGIRDAGLFQSEMARPQNLAAYGVPDAASLAASYAFGLARNHPFIDGNKRTALVVAELFLIKNGFRIEATNPELVVAILDLAAGELTEEDLADWLRTRIV